MTLKAKTIETGATAKLRKVVYFNRPVMLQVLIYQIFLNCFIVQLI